jgi:hypothetical protein
MPATLAQAPLRVEKTGLKPKRLISLQSFLVVTPIDKTGTNTSGTKASLRNPPVL